MAHAIWSASPQVLDLDLEQKIKLADLGGDAAGQGNVDFLVCLSKRVHPGSPFLGSEHD